MVEREFTVYASYVTSSTMVYVDSKELEGMTKEQVKEYIENMAIHQDCWEYHDDSDDKVQYEVEEV